MEINNKKNLLISYLRQCRRQIWLFILFSLIFSIVFYLYQIDIEPVLYGIGLCLFVVFFISVFDFIKYKRKKDEFKFLKENIKVDISHLPKTHNEIELAYQELLLIIYEDKMSNIFESESKSAEIIDYVTMWVHQIKTPIAAIDLLLQENIDHAEEETYYQWIDIQNELFKVEGYVDMVLQFFRLNSTVNDFVLKEYPLDDIIKQAVRKYAPMFIRKKITLNYTPLDVKAITDEKWMVFVIEQLLSNAVKYTKTGSVSIYSEGEKLIIEDTGIGILSEDLPRVMDKGYTGYNGRKDKKATGIGLYLCQQIIKKLSHTISLESKAFIGTRVILDLSK